MCLFCTRKNTILCKRCKHYLSYKSVKELKQGVDKLLIEIEQVKTKMTDWVIPFNYRLRDLYLEADLLTKYLTKHLASTTKER